MADEGLPEGAVQVTRENLDPLHPGQQPPTQQTRPGEPRRQRQDDQFEGLDLTREQMRNDILELGNQGIEQAPQERQDTPPQEERPPQQPQEQEPPPPVEGEEEEDIGVPAELLDPVSQEGEGEGEGDDEDEHSEEDQKLIESMDEKAKAAFIAMRRELAELKKLDKDTTEIRKELQQTRDRLSQYSLAEDPQFQAKYERPLKAKYTEAVEIVKQFGGTEAQVAKLLRMSLKDRIQTIGDELPELASVLPGALSDITRLSLERQQALQTHAETRKQMAQERQAASARQVDEALSAAASSLQENRHFLLKEVKGQDRWNQDVRARHAQAKAALAAAETPQARSELALKAVMADTYRDMYLQTHAALAKLRGHQQGVAQRRPGVASTRTPAADSGERQARPEGGRSGEEVADLLEKRDYSHLAPPGHRTIQ